MNKNLFLVLITLCLFVFVSMVGIKSYKDIYNVNGYTLRFKKNDLENYKIRTKDNTIIVEKRDVVVCNKSICDGTLRDSYTLNTNEEYASFFKSVFDDNEKVKTVFRSDLSEEEYSVLKKIIRDEDELTYKILDCKEHSPYKKRGYYISNGNTIIIASGEKSSGSYSIKIKEVKLDGKDATIYVKEKKLDGITTMELTQPTATIEFNKRPKKIKVLNVDTKDEFSKQVYLDENDILEGSVIKDSEPEKHKERGYYIDYDNYIVYASGGEKTSSEYKMEIEKVKVTDDGVIIYVKESKVNINEDGASSIPTVAIKFNEMPNSITVKGLDTEEEFFEKF